MNTPETPTFQGEAVRRVCEQMITAGAHPECVKAFKSAFVTAFQPVSLAIGWSIEQLPWVPVLLHEFISRVNTEWKACITEAHPESRPADPFLDPACIELFSSPPGEGHIATVPADRVENPHDLMEQIIDSFMASAPEGIGPMVKQVFDSINSECEMAAALSEKYDATMVRGALFALTSRIHQVLLTSYARALMRERFDQCNIRHESVGEDPSSPPSSGS